jgi:hypothetical protein
LYSLSLFLISLDGFTRSTRVARITRVGLASDLVGVLIRV